MLYDTLKLPAVPTILVEPFQVAISESELEQLQQLLHLPTWGAARAKRDGLESLASG